MVEAQRLEKMAPGDPPDQLLLRSATSPPAQAELAANRFRQLLLPIRARMGIVNVLDEMGETEKAKKLCHEVAAAQTLHLGADHPVRSKIISLGPTAAAF